MGLFARGGVREPDRRRSCATCWIREIRADDEPARFTGPALDVEDLTLSIAGADDGGRDQLRRGSPAKCWRWSVSPVAANR